MRRVAFGLVLAACSIAGCFDEFGSFGDGAAGGGGGAADGGQISNGGSDQDRGGSEPGGGPEGGAATELCGNGRDDDGDGAIDCEDAASCSHHNCEEMGSRDGWSGPILLGDEACSGAFPNQGPSGFLLDAPTNPCGCACSLPNNQLCQSELALYPTNDCSGPAVTVTLQPNGCAPIAVTSGSAVALRAPVSGTCAPDATVSLPASTPIASCASEGIGGGCPPSNACLPQVPTNSTECVHRDGDFAGDCPAPFLTRLLLYTEEPSRSCVNGDCACGAAQGGSCTGSVTAFDDPACGSGSHALTSSGECEPISPLGSPIQAARYTGGTASGSSCDPAPTTSPLDFGEVKTLCCR